MSKILRPWFNHRKLHGVIFHHHTLYHVWFKSPKNLFPSQTRASPFFQAQDPGPIKHVLMSCKKTSPHLMWLRLVNSKSTDLIRHLPMLIFGCTFPQKEDENTRVSVVLIYQWLVFVIYTEVLSSRPVNAGFPGYFLRVGGIMTSCFETLDFFDG